MKPDGVSDWMGFATRFARVTLLLWATIGISHQSLAQQGPPVQRPSNPKLIRFELRMSGLHPRKATVEEGRHELRFENVAVRAELELQIDDARGVAVGRTEKKAGAKARAKERLFLNLTPGVYTVRVVGQPNWRSEITVVERAR